MMPFELCLRDSARHLKALSDQHNLEMLVFQPFKNYDGLLSSKRHDEKIAKMKNWFKIAKFWELTPSRSLPCFTPKAPLVTKRPLRRICEKLPISVQKRTLQSALHMRPWPGLHTSTPGNGFGGLSRWSTVPTLGMCIDTYQILAVIWADCAQREW